ncbi:hypothetical protein Leryth_004742 [Lithospermum erythrorhizon]|nr:hypothetical protein Leryth_004742 [Lithospermum erythrorhizon]
MTDASKKTLSPGQKPPSHRNIDGSRKNCSNELKSPMKNVLDLLNIQPIYRMQRALSKFQTYKGGGDLHVVTQLEIAEEGDRLSHAHIAIGFKAYICYWSTSYNADRKGEHERNSTSKD